MQFIGPNLLAADAGATAVPAVEWSSLETLLGGAQSMIEGEELVFAMDVPYMPPAVEPIAATVNAMSAGAAPGSENVVLACKEAQDSRDDSTSSFRFLGPASLLYSVLRERGITVDYSKVRTAVVQGPLHGALTPIPAKTGGVLSYAYDPEPGFLGDDKATFQVTYDGANYKVVVTIRVVEGIDENSPTCFNAKLIQTTPPKPVSDAGGLQFVGWQVNLTDRPGTTLGQVSYGQIALDLDAAGHCWYIDVGPLDNTEYFPTSKSNVWRAKPHTALADTPVYLSFDLLGFGEATGSVTRHRQLGDAAPFASISSFM